MPTGSPKLPLVRPKLPSGGPKTLCEPKNALGRHYIDICRHLVALKKPQFNFGMPQAGPIRLKVAFWRPQVAFARPKFIHRRPQHSLRALSCSKLTFVDHKMTPGGPMLASVGPKSFSKALKLPSGGLKLLLRGL